MNNGLSRENVNDQGATTVVLRPADCGLDFSFPTGRCAENTTPDLFPCLPEPQRRLWMTISSAVVGLEAAISKHLLMNSTIKDVGMNFPSSLSHLVNIVEGSFLLGNKTNEDEPQDIDKNILPHERVQNTTPKVYLHYSGEELQFGVDHTVPVVYEIQLHLLETQGIAEDPVTLKVFPERYSVFRGKGDKIIKELSGATRTEARQTLATRAGSNGNGAGQVNEVLQSSENVNPYIEFSYGRHAYKMELLETGEVVCSLIYYDDSKIIDEQKAGNGKTIVASMTLSTRDSGIKGRTENDGKEIDYEKRFEFLCKELLSHLRYQKGKDRMIK